MTHADPKVSSGPNGITVIWPSGSEVWVRDERMLRGALAMMSAVSQGVGAVTEQERADFDREVMAALREELREVAAAALNTVLRAGDPGMRAPARVIADDPQWVQSTPW